MSIFKLDCTIIDIIVLWIMFIPVDYVYTCILLVLVLFLYELKTVLLNTILELIVIHIFLWNGTGQCCLWWDYGLVISTRQST